MLAFLAFLFTLLFLVSIHEWGHYWVARRHNIKVQRFSIGFGKALWCIKTRSGMEVNLCILPLGGYVKLLDEREGPVAIADQPYAFNRQSISKRISVLSAGALVNIIFAIFAFWFMYSLGFKSSLPEIADIQQNSIAAQAGLTAPAQIIAIDNHRTQRWQQVLVAILARAGEHSTMCITTRNTAEKQQQYRLDLHNWHMNYLNPKPLTSLGIVAYQPPPHTPWPAERIQFIQASPLLALKYSLRDTRQFAYFNLKIIYKLLRRQLPLQSLTSPFSLITASSIALRQGLSIFMGFIGILSVSLGVVNLLPLPGLDGGQILYCLIEAIRKKPLSLALQVLLFRFSLILFVVLLFQAVTNDIVRWVHHTSLLQSIF